MLFRSDHKIKLNGIIPKISLILMEMSGDIKYVTLLNKEWKFLISEK